MPLDRPIVEKWLNGMCHAHLVQCALSTVTDGTNADLNDSIWDGLRRQGIHPADPTLVTTAHMATISTAMYTPFLYACMIALKRRILGTYRSQAEQGVIPVRLEFQKRADGLLKEIEADEMKYEEELAEAIGSAGSIASELLPGTNVPDAILLTRIP